MPDCKYCKTPNRPSASYCVNCGKLLDGKSETTVISREKTDHITSENKRLYALLDSQYEKQKKLQEVLESTHEETLFLQKKIASQSDELKTPYKYKKLWEEAQKDAKRNEQLLKKKSRHYSTFRWITCLLTAIFIIVGIIIYDGMKDDVDNLTFMANRNYSEALKWYQKAAENKTTYAPNDSLGNMFWGGDIDYDNIHAYEIAAKQGNIFALYTMGQLKAAGYSYLGEYFQKDTIAAINMFLRADSLWFTPAQKALGDIFYSQEDFHKAYDWFIKAAKAGNAHAQNTIGVMYANGLIEPNSDSQRVAWYLNAANQGYHWGQYNLGLCYKEGTGVKKNTAEAKRWFEKAAEQGNVSAQLELGCIYKQEKNDSSSLSWFMRAATQHNANAENQIGLIYLRAKNTQEAIKWFRKSGDRGYSWAYFNLGVIYRDGDGIEKDLGKAKEYFIKSSELGNDSSKFILANYNFSTDSTKTSNKEPSLWEKVKSKLKSWL